MNVGGAASASGGHPASSPEAGSAVVEFLFLAVLLLVPIVYLVLTIGRVQAATYAVTGAAREAARAAVTAPPGTSLQTRAEAASRPAFEDHGFASGSVTLRCAADPCLTPNARVEAQVRLEVELPLVPAVLADSLGGRVGVEATHAMAVDRFRAR